MEPYVNQLTCPQGTFSLDRYPDTGNRSLQAWDGGDLLILDHLSQLTVPAHGRILIINDSFGALSCALASAKPDYYNDSLLAQIALERNLKQNGQDPQSVRILSLDQFVSEPLRYDLVIGKIPKHLSYFSMILKVLRTKMHPHTQVIFSALTRHLSQGVYNTSTSVFGAYTTSLASKKARLVFPTLSIPGPGFEPPVPIEDFLVTEPWNEFTLVKLPNTFAQKGIDLGSRLLADNLPERTGKFRILDLGCGNGFLSLAAARAYPEAQIVGIDESALAVRSAQLTFQINGLAPRAHFVCMDGFKLDVQEPFDLVLCNPPFHEQGTVNRKLALGLLLEAKKYLNPGGSIVIVANSSLGYQGVLNEYFKGLRVLAKERGFSVLQLSDSKL